MTKSQIKTKENFVNCNVVKNSLEVMVVARPLKPCVMRYINSGENVLSWVIVELFPDSFRLSLNVNNLECFITFELFPGWF